MGALWLQPRGWPALWKLGQCNLFFLLGTKWQKGAVGRGGLRHLSRATASGAQAAAIRVQLALGFLVNSPISLLWEMFASTGPTPRSPPWGGKKATSWPRTLLLCAGSWAGRAALSPEPQTCTSLALRKAAALAWDFRRPKGSHKARAPPPRWWAVLFSLLARSSGAR